MQNINWGKNLWISLHIITFNYPINPTNEDKINYKNYFMSLGHVLPCNDCKEHYNNLIKQIPIDIFLQDREGITFWLFNIHNLINEKLNKPIINFIDCCIMYNLVYCKSCLKNNDITLFALKTED